MSIKFVVVGAGHIGLRHIAMIMENPSAELVAVIDVLPKEKLGVLPVNALYFNSLEDFLKANIAADVVNICTPNGFHATQTLIALEAGYNVVCEKPFCLHKADAEKIILKSIEKQKQVFCVMQNRYSPTSVWIKELISSKKLGKIYMVQVNCFWNRDERYYVPNSWRGTKDLDGGTLFTQFSHYIDMIYWLFGDIKITNSDIYNFNHEALTDFEDSGNISFVNAEEVRGTFNFSTSVHGQNLESSITIIAENGSLKVGGQYMETVMHCHIKDYVMPELKAINPPNDYGHYKGSAANHVYVIQNVIDSLNGLDKPTTTAFEGMKVVEIIEEMYKV